MPSDDGPSPLFPFLNLGLTAPQPSRHHHTQFMLGIFAVCTHCSTLQRQCARACRLIAADCIVCACGGICSRRGREGERGRRREGDRERGRERERERVQTAFMARLMVVGGSVTRTVIFFLRTCALHTYFRRRVCTIESTTRLVFGLRFRTSLVASRNSTVPNVPGHVKQE